MSGDTATIGKEYGNGPVHDANNRHTNIDANTTKEATTNTSTNTKSVSESSSSTASIHKSKWRPAAILTRGLQNSTKIIGWNDDEFRKIIEDHRQKRLQDPSIPNIEETGFGFTSILATVVKEALYKKTGGGFDDLKSDLQKLEIGGTAAANNGGSSEAKGEVSGSTSIDAAIANVNFREMKVYKNILSAVKYQRDAYIMGTDHAAKRKAQRDSEREKERELEREGGELEGGSNSYGYSYSGDHHTGIQSSGITTYRDYLNQYPTINPTSPTISTSMANTHLTSICSSFIPSQTMHNALLPTVLWTISPPSASLPEGGPLTRRINRSVCDLIPLSQNLLDETMKRSLLYVLSDESWRNMVKGSSRNYLGAGSADAASGGGGGNVGHGAKAVTTKTVKVS